MNCLCLSQRVELVSFFNESFELQVLESAQMMNIKQEEDIWSDVPNYEYAGYCVRSQLLGKRSDDELGEDQMGEIDLVDHQWCWIYLGQCNVVLTGLTKGWRYMFFYCLSAIWLSF